MKTYRYNNCRYTIHPGQLEENETIDVGDVILYLTGNILYEQSAFPTFSASCQIIYVCTQMTNSADGTYGVMTEKGQARLYFRVPKGKM